MEIANVRLRLNKLGSDVPIKDVTPAEAMFLHILHSPYNGGLTFGEEFSKIDVVGTAKVATGKTKRVIVQEAIPEKIVKGAMLKPAVEAQLVEGSVIKAPTPEQRIKGKLLTPEVTPINGTGNPGQPNFIAAVPGKAAVYEPDTVIPPQPERRAAGYQIAAQTAVYAPDQIIPAVEAVVKDEPILADRTNQQERRRLAAKFNGARNKENKPIIDEVWPDKLNPSFPQTFAEINWSELAQSTMGIETAPVNYVTDSNYASTGGIVRTL